MNILPRRPYPVRNAAEYLSGQSTAYIDCATPRLLELAAGVWLLEAANGSSMVAKFQPRNRSDGKQTENLIAVETTVLDLLCASRCPVPSVLGSDQQLHFIFFECVGNATLDDVCQETDVLDYNLGKAVVDGFCHIEHILTRHHTRLYPLIHPAASAARLNQVLTLTGRQARWGMDYLLTAADATVRSQLEKLLEDILSSLSHNQPTLGCTDYNARNIVLDRARKQPAFIEFARIGWDWPERRLAQYLTPLGAGRKNGGFRTLLNPTIADHFAYRYDDGKLSRAAALDGHHIILCLNAAARLGRSLATPTSDRNASLLRLWGEPKARRLQLIRMLGLEVSEDPTTVAFRCLWRRYAIPGASV